MTWFLETMISERRLGLRRFTFKSLRMGGWADVQGLRGEIQLDAFSTESGP